MKRPIALCKGRQRDWLVDVTIDGRTERLPTAHKHFMRGLTYQRADAAWLALAKGQRWLDALRGKQRVVLTDDEVGARNDPVRPVRIARKGYIAVFAVNEIAIDDTGIRFRLMDRIAECAR
jgi:hypothetical protein